MDEITSAVIGFLVPSILSGLIAAFGVGGVLRRKINNNHRQDNMLLALGRYQLLNVCEEILAQGYITATQYEMLTNLYQAYADLGGNGVGKAMYERAIKLTIRDKDGDSNND